MELFDLELHSGVDLESSEQQVRQYNGNQTQHHVKCSMNETTPYSTAQYLVSNVKQTFLILLKSLI